MQRIKILHSSDFHFDTVFSELPSVIAEKRREDLRETFGKIIDIVKTNKVDVLLLAGDLFDNDSIMTETISFIIKKFNEIKETKIFISPGNHDPYVDKSYYRIIDWPSNVHIFEDKLEKIDIKELNCSIYGIGFSKRYERDTLIRNFKVEDPERINIMLMHGEVLSGYKKSDYNPIEEETIGQSGLDYLALGHVHSYSGIKRTGNTFWAYPGNPEGRAFDETGSKGIIIGELGKGFHKLGFNSICKRQYSILDVDVSGATNYEDIIIKINESLGIHDLALDIDKITNSISRNIYKVILTGSIDKEFIISTDVLLDKLQEQFFYVKLINNTELKIDYQELSKEYSLKGLFVKKMLKRIEEAEEKDEKKRLMEALKLGMDALELKEVKTE